MTAAAAAVVSCAVAEHRLHEAMSQKEHGMFFSGEEDAEYDLVTPTSRDAEGQYLSHNLLPDEELLTRRRKRRHADNDDEDKTFIHLSAFGEDHHMELRRNRQMFHENFAINIHDHDGDMRTFTHATDCFHHGNIQSHDDSEIAMSNCDGVLMGTIRKKREIYHVHPLSDSLQSHATHNPDGHTHIVHRVREKTAKEPGHNNNAEQLRKRSKRQTLPEMPAHNVTQHFCHEDGKIEPPMSSASVLQQRMSVDMGDSLVLNEFQRQAAASREFLNNFIHAAIIADHTMFEKYDGDEGFLSRYLLTMFNMVNLIYQPEKSTYAVYVVLINLRILTTRQDNLYITQDSRRLLKNFCNYQQSINPGIGHAHRWNHAFLVTGYGLCFGQDTDCGELGRAPIEGVCTPDRECSVNREGGLNTAFVLAHELGHNVGMFHDGHPTEAGYCPASDGYLMKSSTSDAPRIWTFSSCSVAHLRRYLRSEYSACMDKGNAGATIVRTLQNKLKTQCRIPAGQLFDRNEQCRVQWRHTKHQYRPGHQFKFCDRTTYGREDICRHLYCDDGRLDRGCWSTYTPAMDGTVCGYNKVCWRYKCVPAEKMLVEGNYCPPELPAGNVVRDIQPFNPPATTRPQVPATEPPPVPVNGGWSFYSAFSRCSATCDGGVQYRQRVCNNPTPQHGGRPCEGSDRMYQVCNADKQCAGGLSSRESECRNIGSGWHESRNAQNEKACALYCENRNIDGSVRRRFRRSSAVREGTLCVNSAGYDGRCIRDTCMRVGCDNIINSTAVVDGCGVCNGRGDSCKVFSGGIRNAFTTFGFHPVPLRGSGNSILNGSWDIQLNLTNTNRASLMVLRDNVAGKPQRTYFLHGPGTAIRSGSFAFSVAGTFGVYHSQPNRVQKIEIKGKINVPLVLELLYWPTRGPPNNVIFSWKSPVLPPSERFEWKEVRDYGDCSVTCGTGVQRKRVRCLNKQTGGYTSDKRCERAGLEKPLEQRECMRAPCNTVTVLLESQQQQCNTCSGQVKTMKCVAVNPQDGTTTTVAPRLCNRMERMAMLEECTQTTCEPRTQYCHPDTHPMCKFYEGKPCPPDLMQICSQTCSACNVMVGK
eukprot:scpid30660/ scgid9837/ A disintegrin and metalloproteinase with thrombospondin motifs 18